MYSQLLQQYVVYLCTGNIYVSFLYVQFYAHYQLLCSSITVFTIVAAVCCFYMLMFYNIIFNIKFIGALITFMWVIFMLSFYMHYQLLDSSRIVFTIVAAVSYLFMLMFYNMIANIYFVVTLIRLL